MRGRLGLRTRILALTLPVVALVSAALAGIVYYSLGQLLEASAQDVALSEASEITAELADRSPAEVLDGQQFVEGSRVVQIVDPETDEVLVASTGSPEAPIVTPRLDPGTTRVGTVEELPGQESGTWVVAARDAQSAGGRRLLVLVAVPSRVQSPALGQSAEFATIGAIGLVAALVAGILGMHALTAHGAAPTATSRSAAAAHPAAIAAGTSHDVHDPLAMTRATGPDAGANAVPRSGRESGHGPGHELGGTAALCVLVLAAAGLALLVLHVAGPLLRGRLKVFEPLAARIRTVTWIRGNGPPADWKYSVIRC